MNLKQMYDFFIQAGIENDPRGKTEVEQVLKETKQEYGEMLHKLFLRDDEP